MKPRILLFSVLLLGFVSIAPAAFNYQFSLGIAGFSGYQLTSISNRQLFYGNLSTINPQINLVVGKRYSIVVPTHTAFPLQIIANGGSALGDVVLLSQDTRQGSFNSDAGVRWVDNAAGTVEFTLTPALVAAMRTTNHSPGYRCGVHSATMRGTFAIFGDGQPIFNPTTAAVPKGAVTIELKPLASGLAAPLGAEFANDGTGRVFIYDQAGKIWVVQNGTRLATPFLDVSGRMMTLGVQGPGSYDERGLLGFALHPQFAANHKVYTHTSEPVSKKADFTVSLPPGRTFDHQEVIAEWTVSARNPNAIDPASRRELLRIDHPQFNHNGGSIRFGPDGDLYIGMGDGGGEYDADGMPIVPGGTVGHGSTGNGQNVVTALGKILRIDVNGRNSANRQYGIPADNPFVGKRWLDELYFYGLRNPYAFSFDRANGTLWVGDVGQDNIEEIDKLTSRQKGGDLGWRYKEGTFFFDATGSQAGRIVTTAPLPVPPWLIDPIAQYSHNEGQAIIGGFVYRGAALPELAGKYIFGDYTGPEGSTGPQGRLFYLDTGNVIKEFKIGTTNRKLGLYVKGFAQDLNGEVYVCGSTQVGATGTSGVVLKVVRAG